MKSNNFKNRLTALALCFTLLLGAVCVASALAFGLGGREFAARKLDEWTRNTDKKD